MWTSMARVGAVEVARVYELTLVGQTAAELMPKFDREAVRAHEHWLCPGHFDPESLRLPLDVQSFVLRTDRHVVMIDTCCGNDKDRPGGAEFHQLATGYLDRLAALGLGPEDVDYVMCTHLHVDHIGWNTRLLDGRWVPTFPNARYIVSRDEYRNAVEDARISPYPAVRIAFGDSILPVVEAGLVDQVEPDFELLDILRLRPAPGHTAANVQIELRSGGDAAIFAGDIVHTPIQLPFWEWSTGFCWDPDLAARTRRALFEQCVEENALLVPAHFCAPHMGHVRARGDAFEMAWSREP